MKRTILTIAAAAAFALASLTGGASANAAVSHTPHVSHPGKYTPGCKNPNRAWSANVASGKAYTIKVSYPYTYKTASTSSGYRVTVSHCDQPAIDHTPRVKANGDYVTSCDGSLIYSQSTSAGGTIVIDVNYAYTYTTFSTADGFGVKVYAC